MAQHALGREDDEGLAPGSQRLPPQQVKILRGCRRLANLDVVACGKLEEALDAGARMFGSLPLITVREQEYDSRKQVPLILACRNELVDDDLRAIRKVSELGFPKDQRLGKVAAETVFKAEYGRFGKRRIVNLEPGWCRCDALERHELFFRFD